MWPVHCWQTQPLLCYYQQSVITSLCTGKICPDFHRSVPESMLLKIWDTFYLRAKACILCFDMLILIGGGGEKRVQTERDCACVCAGGDSLLTVSLFSLRISLLHTRSLPVSGNTTILNGFPMLYTHPFHPYPPPQLPAPPSPACISFIPLPFSFLFGVLPFALCTFSSSY